MGTIDERIVKLSFDNKGFESGIQKTLSSLEALNKALEKTDNRQAAKELSKSMNDINKILKNNNLGNLDKLLNKQSGFSKITEGISKMGSGLINAFKKIDFTGIGSKLSSMFRGSTDGASALARGVESVTTKFSHLQVVAATALANITNRMVNAGIAMGKALTIDPIKSGLDEYELKMNSIQTILTNTSHNGTTLDQVNKALAELNTYADKTIYNFGQMTDNIGKFTAAGVDLDTSVASIKGIANLAAASGSSSAQASTAMYQLSQALAAGKVSLMDWNSVVNAGMGGKLFQDALIRTSEHMGTGAEAMIKKFGSFRESLTKGEWLTTDVLTETLKQISGAYTEAELKAQGYTDTQAKAIVQLAENATKAATEVKTVTQLFDTMKESVQSGWAQTWEYIIGDKDQATKMLTSVNDAFEAMIKPGIEARNKMFAEWNKGGGRDAILGGLGNIFGSIGKVAGSVKDAFRDIFPAMTGQKLIEISKGFQKLTENLKISDKTAAKIKDTFKGVFSVFDLAKTGITSVFKAFGGGGGLLSGIGNVFLSATSAVGKLFSAINDGVKSSGIFDKISSGISNGLKNITNSFQQAGEIIKGMFKYLLDFDFGPVFDIFKPFATGLGKGLQDIMSGFGKMLGGFNINGLMSTLGLLAGKGAFDKLKSIFDDVGESVTGLTKIFKNLSDIPKSITEVLKATTDALKAMTTDIQAGALLKIAGAIALLALSLSTLATIDQGGLETALSGITVLFIELIAAFAALSKVTSMGSGKGGFLGNLLGGFFGKGELVTTAAALVGFAAAILVLSAAVKALSSMNPGELITGLAGVAGSMLVLVGAAKLLDGVKVPLIKAGASMILVAAALNVMASAVKKFAEINPNNMLVGLMGIAATLVELAAFMKLADFGGLNVSSAVGLLGVAAALLVLQNAVSKFGSMDLGGMVKGLLGVAGALGIIAGFSHLAGSATSMLVMAAALVVMGGALHVLSSAVRSMAGMDWMDIARGLTVMAGSLAILAAAVKLMSGVGLLAVGAGLVVASAGLMLLANAMKSLAEMSWQEMARGLVAMAGGLLVLGVATAAMSGMVVGAGALLLLAAAMAVLTPQLIAMSNLSWGQIGAGLAMLAGSLLILGVAGLAATAIAPGLAILAGSILLLGVGCLAAGAGVALFATGLATLAAVGAGGMFAITEACRNLINLLPQVGTKLGEALINMGKAFAEGIPTLVASFGQMLTGFLQALVDYGPKIVEIGVQLITLLGNALIQAGPKLVQVAVDLILMLVNALAGAAGQLVDAGANLIINLINGFSSRIGDIIQAAIDLGIALIDGLAQGIQNNAERVGTAIGNLLKVAVDSAGTIAKAALKELGSSGMVQLASGITSGAGKAVTAMGQAVSKAVQSAKSKASQFLSAGKQWVSSLASGVRGAVGTVTGAISSLVSNAVSKARSAASQFLSAARAWVSQLASGIRSGAGQAASAVRSCVSSAVSAARGAAGQFVSAGRSMIQGLISGIKSAAASVASAARSVVQGAINAAKSALKINSPSKVFIEIGKFTGEGFVVGMDRTAGAVANSAANLADSAISNVRDSISKIANAVNDNIDAQPTIRPVLDLSNVEAGARSLNGMLGSSQLSASLSGDMSRSIGTIQNGNNNRELLSAIKDLQGNVGNSGDTYQINGITYDDGSAISSAVQTLIRAAKIERRM
jgi:tape measure domain-containing protein